MAAADALSALAREARESGLIPRGTRGVVLVSGGADSAATAAAIVEVLGPDAVTALHLNYRLRPDSDRDEETVRELSARLGIELEVEHPALGEGNVQAEAREARYLAAERLRQARGSDWIATGHTRTDLAETVLYRLATSPGRRALLGLQPRRGVIVRPLLGLGRDQVRRLVSEAGLPFRDDPTNAEPAYARNRIRNEVLPVLGEIGPEAEATIAETQAELAEEGEALERVAAECPRRVRRGRRRRDRARCARVARPRDPPPCAPSPRRASGAQARCRSGGARGGSDLASGQRAGRAESSSSAAGWRRGSRHGHVRFATGSAAEPAAATLPVPGQLPLRQLGGARGARPERAGRGWVPTSRCSTRVRSAAAWSCGPGAMATGCGRSGSAAASPSRTSSPTARFRGRCGTRCRWSSPMGASPGSRASRSPRSSPRAAGASESAVLSAAQVHSR